MILARIARSALSAFCLPILAVLLAHGSFAQAPPDDSADPDVIVGVGKMQVTAANGTVLTTDALRIDLNSPSVAAGAIIGADDLALTNVRASTEATAQILSGFDANGVLQAGVALGGSPYVWSNPSELRRDYKRDADSLAGILKRTQIGLATKQLPKDGVNRIGLGVSASWELLSRHDLRFADYGYACLRGELRSTGVTKRIGDIGIAIHPEALADLKEKYPSLLVNLKPEEGMRDFTPAEAKARFPKDVDGKTIDWSAYTDKVPMLFVLAELKLDAVFEGIDKAKIEAQANKDKDLTTNWAKFGESRTKCDKIFENYMSDTDSLTLTVAQGYISTTGKFGDLDRDKSAVYLQYRAGNCSGNQSLIQSGERRSCDNASFFGRLAHSIGVPIIGLASYVTDETVKVSDTVEEKADRTIIGLGTAAEDEDGSQMLDFQVSYVKSDFITARPEAEEFKATISYSRKVAKGVWLEFKAGTISSDDVKDESFAGVSFKLSPKLLGGG